MSENYWGKYESAEPKTHYDPLQTFLHKDHPVGFRVNLMPGREARPREQRIKTKSSYLRQEITQEEIEKSPLWRVIQGLEPCVPIAGDDKIIGDPDDPPQTINLADKYDGVSIMNKFAPTGIKSQQATGASMVIYPTEYTRTLDNEILNFNLLRPMRTSLKYLMEGEPYRTDLNTPVTFFNIGPSSGASLKFLHAQTYALKHYGGLNTHGFQQSFKTTEYCVACELSSQDTVTDHLNQTIDVAKLTVWEDNNVRVIVPYAPLRTMATRIIPKDHVDYLGNASDELLISIASALKYADYLMNNALPHGRSIREDRTIPFRQTGQVGDNFHFIIDLLPPFPHVAAEAADFLGMTPYNPFDIASLMQDLDLSHV